MSSSTSAIYRSAETIRVYKDEITKAIGMSWIVEIAAETGD